MRGLKSKENENFKKFFSIVQEKAKEKDKVFFLDCGEGRELVTNQIECEDLSGWLIPEEKSDEFEKEWKYEKNLDKWIEYFCFAIWNNKNGQVSIEFEQY